MAARAGSALSAQRGGAPFGVRAGAGALFRFARANLRDALADRDLEPRLAARRVVEVRNRDAGQALADRLLDAAQVPLFLGRDQREGRSGGFGPRRAADTVNVVVGHGGHVEVHDVPQGRDVDAARGDVGGHEHAILAALEAGQRLGALRLRSVAVDPFHLEVPRREELREPIGAMLRAREHERVVHLALLQQRRQQHRLQVLRDRIYRVRDAGRRRRSPLEIDRRGILEHLPRQLRDRPGHRRAEEQRLAARRDVPEDAADVGQEAHVEHAVGLRRTRNSSRRASRRRAEVIRRRPGVPTMRPRSPCGTRAPAAPCRRRRTPTPR